MENIVSELRTRLQRANLTEGKRQSDFCVTFLRGAAAATSDPETKLKLAELIADVSERGVEAIDG